jgi:serine/threonine protein kinase
MPWQFLVVDGADAERVFLLPESGVVLIGSSRAHADICLHDLYVGRTHCEVEVSPAGKVRVRNLRPADAILVNKIRIEEQELNVGDILRVGNSHLKLEPASEPEPLSGSEPVAVATEAPPSAPEPKPEGPRPLPVLPPERLSELAGHVLSHYQLDELLNQNNSAAVFQARHRKTGQPVVLKVLSPRFPANADEMRRFIEVMRRALALRHENLVSLCGVGRTGPYTWIAREHVPGESLADVLERIVREKKKPKWQSAVRLARQLGSALAYAHENRLRHGHLAPHNILINTETKTAKLANLLLDQALAGSQLLQTIRAERRSRDLGYFSPEQCEPGAFVDELSDQYRLGALIYARLTGRPPFAGATPEETVRQIRSAPLVRPRELNQAIPPEVEAVVVRMLSRRQEDRYPNPAALLADLERLDS